MKKSKQKQPEFRERRGVKYDPYLNFDREPCGLNIALGLTGYKYAFDFLEDCAAYIDEMDKYKTLTEVNEEIRQRRLEALNGRLLDEIDEIKVSVDALEMIRKAKINVSVSL